MGIKLNINTSFCPQTDGETDRTIQTVEDMLRACALDFKGSCYRYLPLIEFAYNNSYQALEWHYMKHFTDDVVDHRFASMNLGKEEPQRSS